MRLVLIGTFKEARNVEKVEALINKLARQAEKEEAYNIREAPPEQHRFSEEMMSMFTTNELFAIDPIELEQFALEHSIEAAGDKITIRTDEGNVSAFIKIMINAGARVEVYSAHDYPDE